jgi:hypothetical protein
MGDKEKKIINERLLNLSKNERLFRINAGMGWTGKIVKKTKSFIILKDPRPLYAAPAGWPDLCGWTEIEITPDMVGKKISVFTAEEIKAGKQKIKKDSDQDKFRNVIQKMGGIFRVLS